MCGFVAVLDPRARRPADEAARLVRRLADTMAARGPDDAGVWVDEAAGVALGHRRLAVLDLSPAGAQPMVSADGRWVIAYNGEIYGHRGLARRLRGAGVPLRGHSDTEVLVEAIARWGLGPTLDRVDGMFAFALWDRRDRRLTLARDRMGEKPCYVGTLGSGEVVAASTLDALRAHPGFDRPVDRDALALYFRHKYVPAPHTIHTGVAKLEPGCTLTVTADGAVGAPQRYWSFFDVVARGVTFDGTPAEAVDELDRRLGASVRDRLVADVPVGAFLSGGIDSSAVVAAACRESPVPVRTFTIGSPDAGFDESADARAVARHLGCEHTELVVTDAQARAAVEDLAGVWDEPFGDSSQLPTLLVARLARAEVTVALSGDGGDELFLGYNRYQWVPAIWARLGRVPVPLRRVAARLGGRVRPVWWDRAGRLVSARRRPRQLGLKATKVLGVADATSAEEVFRRVVSHWTEPAALVPGAREPATVHTDPRRWPPTVGLAEHMAAVDTVTYLPDDILTKVDRATMSVGLEGRIPLLSRDVVEFAAGLPVPLRLRDGRTKWPLRRLLARSVPPELFDRPKAGFGVPIDRWLTGPLADWAAGHLHGPAVAEFLDPAVVGATWRSFRSGRSELAYRLWDVVMFSAWWERAGRPGS